MPATTMASSAPPSRQRATSTQGGTDVPAPEPEHSCFICLSNELETPGETFVHPCPCTLEAHESCLLRWVAESEVNRSQSRYKPPRCPACNARIRVDEPRDAVVALRNGIYRSFAHVSPYVLLSLVLGGSAVGSAWYGLLSTHMFAGPEATARWLGIQTLVNRRPNMALWRWAPMWSFTAKTWALSLVGPGLVIWRAIPAVDILLIPSSFMSAAILVAFDDMPTWPPSPAWAITIFPLVSMTYNSMFYEFFGAFNQRLNRALRARPVEDDREAEAGQDGRDDGQQGGHDDQEPSIWAAMRGLGQAVVGLFRDQEIGLDAQVEVGPHVEGQGAVELQIEIGGEEVDDEEGRALMQEFQEILNDGDMQEMMNAVNAGAAAQQNPPAQPPRADDVEPALAPAQPAQNNNNNDDNDDAAAAPAADNNPAGLDHAFSYFLNSIALSLLYPSICYGMGELLRIGLPRSWVTRPATSWGIGRMQATGLLQRRWGRSLVGGCLYVVLKDTFQLYAKYRQVQQKSRRKVRNVERRRGASS